MQQAWSMYSLAAILTVLMNGLFSAKSQRSARMTDIVYQRYIINWYFIRTNRRLILKDLV